MRIMKSRKFLLSLVCALVLVFGSCMTVCAESDEAIYQSLYSDLHEIVYSKYGELEYQIFTTSSVATTLIASDKPLYIYNDAVYCVSGSVACYIGCGIGGKLHSSEPITGFTNVGLRDVIYSNYDVCDESGNVVNVADSSFFPKPQTLAPVVRGMKMNPLAQILGLLPLLIPCLVGLVALRKGLQALWNHLHKA